MKHTEDDSTSGDTDPPPDRERKLRGAELFEEVYDELKAIAGRYMSSESKAHTLQPTALVHELFLKLCKDTTSFESRRHFFGTAAKAMQRILVEAAREKKTQRRGGAWKRVELDSQWASPEGLSPQQVIELAEAVDALEQRSPGLAEVVRLRHFAGLEIQKIGEILGASRSAIYDRWTYAKAWLYRFLTDPDISADAG